MFWKRIWKKELKESCVFDENNLTFVFQKQPILRATIEEKITKEFIDRTAPLAVVKTGNSKKWMYAAALIPLAFLAGWMPNNVDLSGGLNTANFSSFTPEVKTVYVPIKSDFVFI